LSEQALNDIAPSIRAISANGESTVSREFIARFPALEVISVFGVGYDGVDVAAARERGIHVTHTPDVLTDDVADFAMTLLFAVRARWCVPTALPAPVNGARVRFRSLPRSAAPGSGLSPRPRSARRLPAAQKVSTWISPITIAHHSMMSPGATPPTLKGLAAEVDFLVLSTPGGANTRALINADILEALGPKGFLINVARGSVVDETALDRSFGTRQDCRCRSRRVRK